MTNVPEDYQAWMQALRDRVSSAHAAAAVSVNRELVLAYWDIGSAIIDKQTLEGWGAKVIDRLSADLTSSFVGSRSFSPRSLKYMRAFAKAWPDRLIVQQAVAQLPWGQNVVLLDKLTTQELRLWYANEASSHGWSRAVLVHQIDTQLHTRQGMAMSNFGTTMPAERSAAAEQLFKDPYLLDFIDLPANAHERHLETPLVDRIRQFLLELGKGFAFIGNQQRLDVGGQEFYLDLLFYHTKLHCYVVIDLKMGDFEPEFVGKMNFYLAAVDQQIATPEDHASIGLILCKGKNGIIVEYALRDVTKPVAVAEYKVLPPSLRDFLPSIEDLEASLLEDANPPTQETDEAPTGPKGK